MVKFYYHCNSMNRYFLLVILSLTSAACSSKKDAQPLVNRETMVKILVDMHLLEANQQLTSQYEKGRAIKTIMGYEMIFLEHKVEPKDFYETFAWYRNNPKEMEELYQLVIEEATRRESEINAGKNDRDTINQINPK